ENFTAHEQVSAICISYYWHFVDVVWIVLFFIVYMLDPILSLGNSGHVIPVDFNWRVF
ncbi:MAG: cytochrome c oxidase subunit 3, partial [Brachybacterium sp.]